MKILTKQEQFKTRLKVKTEIPKVEELDNQKKYIYTKKLESLIGKIQEEDMPEIENKMLSSKYQVEALEILANMYLRLGRNADKARVLEKVLNSDEMKALRGGNTYFKKSQYQKMADVQTRVNAKANKQKQKHIFYTNKIIQEKGINSQTVGQLRNAMSQLNEKDWDIQLMNYRIYQILGWKETAKVELNKIGKGCQTPEKRYMKKELIKIVEREKHIPKENIEQEIELNEDER